MRSRGFTLIEMLVVLAILGVLAAAARPLLELSVRRMHETELRAALRTLRGGIDAYKRAADAGNVASPADGNGYPANLQLLVAGVPDQRSPNGRKIYFLRSLPRDPMVADTSVPAAETWALRASDSPPDDPKPGRDVFDVHSKAGGKALDGTLYTQW